MIVTHFRCTDCATLHESEFRAEACCPPEIEEVEVCSLCGEEYQFEDAPITCPCEIGENGEVPLPPQSFLEQHGQQRMF